MKKKIQTIAILITAFTISANAAIEYEGSAAFVRDGSITNIIGDGGSALYLSAGTLRIGDNPAGGNVLTVATNGTLTVDSAIIGPGGSNNRLVLQDGSTSTFSGFVNVGPGSGLSGNVLEIQSGASASFSGSLLIGNYSGTSDSTLILGGDISVGDMYVNSGTTIDFAGGAMSINNIVAFSDVLLSFTGDYQEEDILVSANALDWSQLLTAFNDASDRYVFRLDNSNLTGANTIIVDKVIPEPASVLMVVFTTGLIAFFRRLFFSRM